MRSILESLYEGELFPSEKCTAKDPQYRELNREITQTAERLRKQLAPDQLRDFDALQELQMKSCWMEKSASFIYGFKLCGLMLLEILSAEDEYHAN